MNYNFYIRDYLCDRFVSETIAIINLGVRKIQVSIIDYMFKNFDIILILYTRLR